MDINHLAQYLLSTMHTLQNTGIFNFSDPKNIHIVSLSGHPLLSIDPKGITLPHIDLNSRFLSFLSPLSDCFVNFNDLSTLLSSLSNMGTKFVLNHIGLCYFVKSQGAERKFLMETSRQTKLNLFEIPSKDFSLWLFIGEHPLEDPVLIELLPVQVTTDYYIEYWLPHIHIDLITNSTVADLKMLTHYAFKGTRTANPLVVINGSIHSLRIWLGVVSGVNICLDFSFSKSMNKHYHRKALNKITAT